VARHLIGLTDAQLGLLFAAASVIPYGDRDRFLRAFADQLHAHPALNDAAIRGALAAALIEV
jgi:hypothetical protein